VVALAALAAACTRGADPAPAPHPNSPFAACPAARPEPVVPPPPDALPAVTLPCFTGDELVALAQLGRPAVINLWASWCTPCRGELPALQAFADEMGDLVLVLGVVTDDVWDRAAATASDLGAHYPNVFDEQASLQKALGRIGLPMTLFVAADGSVRGTDVSGQLTVERLRTLSTRYLGR
jgi:thiol-disulfide isomerase/thioredoxin